MLTPDLLLNAIVQAQKTLLHFDQKTLYESMPFIQKIILKEIVKIWREIDESTVLSVSLIVDKIRQF